MIKIEKILVPIDFSSYSKDALKYAVKFARQFKSELLLVHVVEPVVYPSDFNIGQVGIPSIQKELQEKAEKELNKIVTNVIKRRVRSSVTVRVGKPFVEITNTADENNVDLIIMATHGHTGIGQILFGSTAERVVRKSVCPVLTVRPGRTSGRKK